MVWRAGILQFAQSMCGGPGRMGLLGFVGVVVLAFPAVAEPPSELAANFPDGAAVYAEFRDLEAVADQLLANQPLVDAYLPVLDKAKEQPGFRRLMAAQQFIRKQLDTDLPTLARQLLGQDVAAALYPSGTKDPHVLVMARAKDAEYVKQVTESVISLVELFAGDKISLSEQQGARVASLDGKAFIAVAGTWLAMSNKRSLLNEAIDRHTNANDKPGLAAKLTPPQTATSQPSANSKNIGRLWVDIARLVADSKDPNVHKPIKVDNLIGVVLASGALELIRESATLHASLDLGPSGIALTAILPRSGSELPEAYQPLFPTADKGAMALLQPNGYLAGITLFGDINHAYAHRETLIHDHKLPEIDQFEDGLQNLLPGRDFATDVLPTFGPRLQLVFARQSYEHLSGRPEVELPAGALVWQMVDAKRGADLMRLVFQTVVTILNFTSNQRGGEPMVTDLVSHQGVTITYGKYLNPPSKATLPVSFNYTPALAVVDDYVIASSSVDLARGLVDQIKAGQAVPQPSLIALSVNAKTIIELLEANRNIVEARLVQQGKSAEQAAYELGAGLVLLNQLRDAALSILPGQETTTVSLEVRWP